MTTTEIQRKLIS